MQIRSRNEKKTPFEIVLEGTSYAKKDEFSAIDNYNIDKAAPTQVKKRESGL